MHTIQTLAVFLWLLPVAAHIILPLGITVVMSLYKLVSNKAAGETAPAELQLNAV